MRSSALIPGMLRIAGDERAAVVLLSECVCSESSGQSRGSHCAR